MSILDIIGEIEQENTAVDPTKVSSGISIAAVVSQGASIGERNVGLTRLAGLLRSHGFEGDIIRYILVSVNGFHGMGLPDREVSSIATSISRYPVKSEYRPIENNHILTVDDLYKAWKKEKMLYGKPIDFGFPTMTAAVHRFLPGEILVVAGRSGTGKTSMLLHLARVTATGMDSRAFFASLEMSGASLYHRMSTIACNAEDWDTINEIDAHAKTKEKYNGILTVDKDSLTIEQIEKYLATARETHSSIPIVAIDYMGYLRDITAGSQYEKVSRIAREVKAFAKRTECRVILGCQTSRAGEAGDVPVQLHHLRDSGAIEESADIVLGMWGDSTDQDRRHCQILKNRHGRNGERFDVENNNLSFTEIPVVDKGKTAVPSGF